MKGKTILTDEKFAMIPQLMAEGLSKLQIAERFGCTVNTLQVKCSHRGISLRPLALKRNRPLKYQKLIQLDPDVIRMYDDTAEAKGLTTKELVNNLLTVIAKDGLIDAVLDEEA